MSEQPPKAVPTSSKMEKVVALCKRKGFIFQSSEIYGGINGFWDYGPLGVELKRNLKEAWWTDIIRCPGKGPDGHPIDMVGLDSTIIMNPKVWIASGHVGGFSDPMVDCRETKQRAGNSASTMSWSTRTPQTPMRLASRFSRTLRAKPNGRNKRSKSLVQNRMSLPTRRSRTPQFLRKSLLQKLKKQAH